MFFRSSGEEKDYFIENFAMLLSAGIDINSALESVKKDIVSKKIIAQLDAAQMEISAGSPVSQALEKHRLLPPNLITLVRIGEQTGRLPENLRVIRIAQQKEQNLK